MPSKRIRVASPPTGRPLALFDGDCRFCRLWVDRWTDNWPERVDFAPARTMQERFPEIPATAFAEALHLVENDGVVSRGAEAALRIRALARGRRGFVLWAYYDLPGVRPVLDAAYDLVAANRAALGRLIRIFHGANLLRPRFSFSTDLFLRGLALVYLIAFGSFWWQMSGLIGPDGILPARDYLDAIARQLGGDRWWIMPTLCWLFGAGAFLHVLCLAGVGLAVLAFLRIAQPACFALLWLGYLSLCAPGQVFLNFQWDALLLEAGLLAVLMAPWRWKSPGSGEPPAVVRWLLCWLLFRLMFVSGLVKLTSGDPVWRDLTALMHHYETQPLPTWIGWWAHQLPAWFQRLSCAIMFMIELVLPFFVFGPRRLRLIAALGLIALQGLIALTGNYTFFNLLTLILCLPLLDNAWWSRWVGVASAVRRPMPGSAATGRWLRGVAAATLFAASVLVTLPSLLGPRAWPEWCESAFRLVAATRSVNSYGLFRVMTTRRPEIVFEGSDDGRVWEAYECKWKPGDLKRRPAFVVPYQPRLDWQLWFAALAYPQRQQWVANLANRLLLGSPAVTRLFAHNPFPAKPPVYLRAVLYEYEFTDPAQRRRTGEWWRRTPVDYYFRPLSLRRS